MSRSQINDFLFIPACTNRPWPGIASLALYAHAQVSMFGEQRLESCYQLGNEHSFDSAIGYLVHRLRWSDRVEESLPKHNNLIVVDQSTKAVNATRRAIAFIGLAVWRDPFDYNFGA
jgi:hypothetical protein